jgi:hypothetical protein
LPLTTAHRLYVVVPTSANDFLAFDPNDLAEYQRFRFTVNEAGAVCLAAADEVGDPILTATKAAAAR